VVPIPRSKLSTLQQLIFIRDWQRVLIRVKLYPGELRQYILLQLRDANEKQVRLRALPLHLVCAMNPPDAVVELMLKFFPDASGLPVQSVCTATSTLRKICRKSSTNLGIRVWDRNNEQTSGRTDIIRDDNILNEDVDRLSFDDNEHLGEDDHTSYLLADEDIKEDDKQSYPSSPQSSLSSRQSLETNGKDFVFQLSLRSCSIPTLLPMNETTSLTSTSKSSVEIFRIHWDMEPLYRFIFKEGGLLPLHIASLYRSSDGVLQKLVEAYPAGALVQVMGMLPIHFVAAGWSLPPLEFPSQSLVRLRSSKSPLSMLRVLVLAAPESLQMTSGNHGMTPSDYIEECMEDGTSIKKACLGLLFREGKDLGSQGSCDPIFADSSDEEDLLSRTTITANELIACITTLIVDNNWDYVLTLIEDDPALAEQWLYGVDEIEAQAPVLWKRLPIQLACARGAPLGLISTLLDVFPGGAAIADPHDGSLPLHIACKNGASECVIRALLKVYPEAASVADLQGRIPLHVAAISGASLNVLEALVMHDMLSVSTLDRSGKTPVDYVREKLGHDSLVIQFMSTLYLFPRYDIRSPV